ncbi:MAG TPA: nuclease-related domain-containing protein [Gammaproteobacteria bacterium]|nr:nuclease-related domain-containing protein [Gammaproteobacteria bacterium]
MEVLLIIILFIVFLLAFKYHKNKIYKKGAYYQITRNTYSSIKYDKGKYAEYLTYESLRHFEDTGGKFLFNALIPRERNKTTEVDVILICSKGLFVFECKNYGGWIFGHEAQKNWVQVLPRGRGRCHKEYFYNPIMQNASHIKHLKNLLGKNVVMWSIIIFSDRCVLKDIIIKSNDIIVINHDNAASAVAQVYNEAQTKIYTETEIHDIYHKLYPYTQLDNEAKEKHKQELSLI